MKKYNPRHYAQSIDASQGSQDAQNKGFGNRLSAFFFRGQWEDPLEPQPANSEGIFDLPRFPTLLTQSTF